MAHRTRIGLLVLVLTAAASGSARAQTSGQPPTSNGTAAVSGPTPPIPSQPVHLKLPVGDQMTNIPYFSLRDGMSSTLTLNNTAGAAIPVMVTIYNREGRSQQLAPITLDPHSFKQIELRDVVASDLFDSGSLQIGYGGTPMLVTCQLSVYSLDKRVSFEVREQAMMDFESPNLNGILSLPATSAEGFLAVTNVAANDVKVQVTSGKTKEFSLHPHETQLVKLNEGDKEPLAQMVKLRQNGKPGDVVSAGFVLDLKNGYSSRFTMEDPKLMRDSVLAGAHIRFGPPDPNEGFPPGTTFSSPLMVANVSNKPVNAHVSVDYTVKEKLAVTPIDPKKGDTQDKVSYVHVKDLTIAPGDVQRTDLAQEMARFNVPGPVEEASVEIAYDADPGALIGQLTSVDQSGDYSFEVPIKDPTAIGEWPQGVYPWTLENGTSSVLHLKNFTEAKELAQVDIRFAGGVYSPKMLVLEPHQTIAIDIRKLRDSQTPDEFGHMIPLDVTQGQLWWGAKELATIIGRNEEVNVSEGIAKSFSCAIPCCGSMSSSYEISPGSATMLVSTSGTPLTTNENDYTCKNMACTMSNGKCYPNYNNTGWYETYGNWYSSNTGVATLAAGNGDWSENPSITTTSTGGSSTITADFCSTTGCAYACYGCGCSFVHYYCQYTYTPVSVGVPLQSLKLGSLQISVTSTPISGQTNSVVSGQAATVSVTAKDQNGAVFALYTGTVHFSSTDTFASLPSDYTFTAGDAGTHTFNNVTLKTVSGTSSTRDLTVKDNATSISATVNPNVWFHTTMDVENWKNCGFTGCVYDPNTHCPTPNGSYFCTTAYLGCTPNQPSGYSSPTTFISITKKLSTSNVGVTVAYNGTSSTTIVGDLGPQTNNAYWNTGTIPAQGGCLSDALATDLGINNGCNPGPFGQASIYWRFN